MRKKRVVIFDDEPLVLNLLENLFMELGYEVFSFSAPKLCPIYEEDVSSCMQESPCADIVISDIDMPRMNGLELIENQKLRGCKLEARNKAVISGFLKDEYKDKIKELGCHYFHKPFELSEILAWVNECEKRINLEEPLGTQPEE